MTTLDLDCRLMPRLVVARFVEARDVKVYGKLKRSAEGRAVPLPGIFGGTDADVALLTLDFARGEPSQLAVPYARRAEA